MSGKIILDSMRVDLAVDMTVNVDEAVLSMLGTRRDSRRDGMVGGKDLTNEIVSSAA